MLEIISKENCQFCTRAKQLLDSKKIPYIEKKLGVDISRDEVLELYPVMKTVPIITTTTGRLIGGFTQLNQLNLQGILDEFSLEKLEDPDEN